MFSTSPSYRWSPCRRKYTCCSGFETTAIIPVGELETPSTRTVATTNPAFPGGRCSSVPTSFFTSIKATKGSRLEVSAADVAAGAGAAPAAGVASAFAACEDFSAAGLDFAAGFAGVFAAVFTGAFADAFAGAAGLAAGCAGFVCAVATNALQPRTTVAARILLNRFDSVIVRSYRFAAAAGAVLPLWPAAFVKNVVMVKVPLTEVPGVVWNLPAELLAEISFTSPTLIIRESLPSLAKKSRTEKYGPSASTVNGISK